MRYTITKATIRRILPIALTFTLIIAYIAFFYYSNLASTVFASHLSGDLVRQMHIDYDSGFVISGRNERNGLVVGTLSDTQTRQRLLQNQPFTNCAERCDTWKPVEHTTFIPILENNNLPDDVRHTISTVSTQPSTRCASRHTESFDFPQKTGENSPHYLYRSRETLCLSSNSGKFVYILNRS